MAEHIFSMAVEFTEFKLCQKCLTVNFIKMLRIGVLKNTSVLLFYFSMRYHMVTINIVRTPTFTKEGGGEEGLTSSNLAIRVGMKYFS